jgi:hypothetical protein
MWYLVWAVAVFLVVTLTSLYMIKLESKPNDLSDNK